MPHLSLPSTPSTSVSSFFRSLRPRRTALALFALSAVVVLPVVRGEGKTRKITVTNNCKETVWPAIFTGEGTKPDHPTGWEATAGHTTSFTVEEIWGGRIWPRTECDFTTDQPDYLQCCKGGLECAEVGGTGRLPVTLAEFNIQEAVDHYDTSNVDGFNVPLAVTNSQDCPLSNCPYDLRKTCPDDLQFKNDAGEVAGCLTDCGAHGENEEYCCSGAHATPDTCPSSAIPNYPWWKKSCPIAYAFAYDEASGTALFTCTKRVDWTITFCPDETLFETTATLPNGTTITQEGELPEMADESASGGTGVTTGDSQPTATGETGGGDATATDTGTPTTTAAGGDSSGGGDGGSSGGGGDASKTSTTKASSGGSSPTSGSSNSGGTSSSDSSSEDTILGMPAMVAYGILGLLALLIVGGIIAFVVMQNKKKDGGGGHHHHRAATSESETASDDDDEKDSASDDTESDDSGGGGGGGGRKKKHRRRSSDDDDDVYSLAKFSALEAAERDAASRSVYAAAARDPGGLSSVRNMRGASGQLFTLPKTAEYPSSEAKGRPGRAFR
ncbi:hypothetical protein JCM6882_008913 [Rhodosporidiobolus microsporus]